MPFIATIAKENDSNFIRNSIIKNGCEKKFEVINVNLSNIENIKNIKFDIIVIDQDIKEFLTKSNYIYKLIENSKYIVINSDIIKTYDFVKNKNIKIITYGLNKKADFTISSIADTKILVCNQKEIERADNKLLEEQEFNIIIKKNNLKKVHNTLPIFIILSIYGIFLKKI